MPERAEEPEFAWYRLQGREIAALAALGVLLVALSAWAWFGHGATHEPEVKSRELPPARVNVNTAGESELTALPGIGEAKARRIVEARKQAPITSLEQLSKAAGGIPGKDLERMSPYVRFSD